MAKRIWPWVIVAAVAAVLIGWGVRQSQQGKSGVAKIGILMPLHGDLAVFGEKGQNGAKLAAANLPTDKFQFVYEDGGSTPKEAVTAASKLINIDKVDAVVGPFGPDQTLAVAPIVPNNVPLFAFSLCNKDFAKYPNLFCGYPGLDKQVATAYPFMQKEGIKKLALISENSELGLDARNAILANATSVGYQVAVDEQVQPDEKDFRTVVAKTMAVKPDGVFVVMTDPAQAFNFLKQLYLIGYRGIRIAQIDTDPQYLKDFGAVAEGVYVPGNLPNNYSAVFMDTYKAEFNSDADLYGALIYDMTNYAAKLLQANGWSGENAAGAIASVTYADPAIPAFKFLSDRTAILPLELWVAKNGEYIKASY